MRSSPAPAAHHAHQLRRSDEQPLVAGLPGPAEVAASQGSFELGPVVVAQRVQQRRMSTAERAERLEDRRVGPGALHRRGATAGDLPAPPAGHRVGQVEDRRLAHSGRPCDQHRDPPSGGRLVEDRADPVADASPPEEPGAPSPRPAAAPCVARSRGAAALRSSSARRRTASAPGEAPSSRCNACSSRSSWTSAPRTSPPADRSLARARCAASSAGSSARTSSHRPSSRRRSRCWWRAALASIIGPRLVRVVGQQRAGVPPKRLLGQRQVAGLQCLGGRCG